MIQNPVAPRCISHISGGEHSLKVSVLGRTSCEAGAGMGVTLRGVNQLAHSAYQLAHSAFMASLSPYQQYTGPRVYQGVFGPKHGNTPVF